SSQISATETTQDRRSCCILRSSPKLHAFLNDHTQPKKLCSPLEPLGRPFFEVSITIIEASDTAGYASPKLLAELRTELAGSSVAGFAKTKRPCHSNRSISIFGSVNNH